MFHSPHFFLNAIDKTELLFYNSPTTQTEGARTLNRDNLLKDLLEILEKASLRELQGLIEFAKSYIK
jgi:hypothetical protein